MSERGWEYERPFEPNSALATGYASCSAQPYVSLSPVPLWLEMPILAPPACLAMVPLQHPFPSLDVMSVPSVASMLSGPPHTLGVANLSVESTRPSFMVLMQCIPRRSVIAEQTNIGLQCTD